MKSLDKHSELKNYYSTEKVSKDYLGQRFTSAIGRVLHEKQVAIVNKIISETGAKSILELACGPARLTCDIICADTNCAVDGSPAMLKIAQQRLKEAGKGSIWKLQEADIFELNMERKFDLIYTFRFIRHFKLDDRKKIYGVIRKHLNDGGSLIFDVVNEKVSAPIREKGQETEYNIYDELYERDGFIAEMEAEGWKVERLIPVHPKFNLLYNIQVYIAPRSNRIAYGMMKFIENKFSSDSLEWIAVCK
ncbi:MAG: class I SAM-dependent methyltransferase [Candidatus Auribacterota bacterium]|jgi:SAM-dependent methyltransferase|nr:class I SAM-dependent methyltransferase [Candidatus Auribacterota bacterium]